MNELAELPAADRPQERLELLGPSGLRDTELLAIVLRNGSRGHGVMQVADGLLREAGSLAALSSWTTRDFMRQRGIGRIKALQLSSLIELARRLHTVPEHTQPLMREPADIARFLCPRTTGLEVEKFWTLCLNTRRRLIRCVEVTSGTATASLAHPREVFREAIRLSASCVAIAHNHPSGDPEPSSADVGITRQLREAARVTGIELVDHIIVGRPEADPSGRGFFSFRLAGLM
jgi:DNA repair protein RadC